MDTQFFSIQNFCIYIYASTTSFYHIRANFIYCTNYKTFINNYFKGYNIARNIVSAYHVAIRDIYRACTHNKGIMNGIDALAIATGNDWRAIEANAHTYAAREGIYTSLTMFSMKYGALQCYIELPIAIGVIGGSIKSHPLVIISHKILGSFSSSTKQLSGVMAAVGLSQNLAALRALVSEGIQKGHMLLHAKQIGLSAGASDSEIKRLTYNLIKNNQISLTSAQLLLKNMRNKITKENKS